MEYIIFVCALLGIIIISFVFQYINFKKSDKIYAQKLKEEFGKVNKSSYDGDCLKTASDYFVRHIGDNSLDEITWSDLSMDNVFSHLCQTQSDMGTQVLYNILRNPLTDAESIKQRSEYINFWRDNPDLRLKIQLSLHHYDASRKYSLFDNLDRLGEQKTPALWTYYLQILLLFLSVISIFFLDGAGVIIFILILIINMSRYYKERAQILPFLSVYKRILSLIEIAADIQAQLSSSKQCTKGFEAHSENIEKSLDKLKSIKRKTRLSKCLEADGNPLLIFINLLSALFFLDISSFYVTKDEIIEKREDIELLFYQIGLMDASISLASYKTSFGTRICEPEFNTGSIRITDLYHPLIENPVENDVYTDRSFLLTGSNASGKSTCLKSVALAFIYAQCFGFVHASGFTGPIARICSAMSLRDNVISGDSYYMAEIKAIKRIFDINAHIDRSKEVLIAFIDELLSGTNTMERIAAGTQILRRMVEDKIFVFSATHDIELTSLLSDYYDNYHFSEDLSGGDVVFSYKLQKGEATSRNAIKLLNNLGFPEDIITEAERMVNEHIETGSWSLQKV